MLRCFSLKSTATKPSRSSLPSSSSAPHLQSTNDASIKNPNSISISINSTPTSSPDQDPSPAVSLSHEYDLVVQADSYTEIRDWVIVQKPPDDHNHHLASPPLRPNRGSVDEALGGATPSKLTCLVSSYFDHSERTSRLLYSLLGHSLHQAKSLYYPLHDLLDVLPLDNLTQPQCDRVYDVFVEFNCSQNPFPCKNSHTLRDMPRCFTQLKQQVDRRLRRAQSRSRFPHWVIRGSAVCIFSAVIRGPARVTLPPKFVKKQLRHIAQLDAAAMGAYVVNIELDTINCLVERLYDAVENDRSLVRFVVERGRDRYAIQVVVKQLMKNRPNLEKQMKDLEDHVCICLNSVNRTRSRLLEEIQR